MPSPYKAKHEDPARPIIDEQREYRQEREMSLTSLANLHFDMVGAAWDSVPQ